MGKNKERVDLQKEIQYYVDYAEDDSNEKIKRVNAKLKVRKLRLKINKLMFSK